MPQAAGSHPVTALVYRLTYNLTAIESHYGLDLAAHRLLLPGHAVDEGNLHGVGRGRPEHWTSPAYGDIVMMCLAITLKR
jgi:hypothetical protein